MFPTALFLEKGKSGFPFKQCKILRNRYGSFGIKCIIPLLDNKNWFDFAGPGNDAADQ